MPLPAAFEKVGVVPILYAAILLYLSFTLSRPENAAPTESYRNPPIRAAASSSQNITQKSPSSDITTSDFQLEDPERQRAPILVVPFRDGQHASLARLAAHLQTSDVEGDVLTLLVVEQADNHPLQENWLRNIGLLAGMDVVRGALPQQPYDGAVLEWAVEVLKYGLFAEVGRWAGAVATWVGWGGAFFETAGMAGDTEEVLGHEQGVGTRSRATSLLAIASNFAWPEERRKTFGRKTPPTLAGELRRFRRELLRRAGDVSPCLVTHDLDMLVSDTSHYKNCRVFSQICYQCVSSSPPGGTLLLVPTRTYAAGVVGAKPKSWLGVNGYSNKGAIRPDIGRGAIHDDGYLFARLHKARRNSLPFGPPWGVLRRGSEPSAGGARGPAAPGGEQGKCAAAVGGGRAAGSNFSFTEGTVARGDESSGSSSQGCDHPPKNPLRDRRQQRQRIVKGIHRWDLGGQCRCLKDFSAHRGERKDEFSEGLNTSWAAEGLNTTSFRLVDFKRYPKDGNLRVVWLRVTGADQSIL